MVPTVLFIFLFSLAQASFTNCATHEHGIRLKELYADPPGIVGKNQHTSFRIRYEVLPDAFIPRTSVVISTTANGIPIETIKSKYSDKKLLPKEYTFETSFNFPGGVWGRISTDINLYNISGAKLMCARWSVFATNSVKNETSWPF